MSLYREPEKFYGTAETPEVSFRLALHPSSFSVDAPPPMLHVTATSHASEPVTIYMRNTILNTAHALRCGKFVCYNKTTGERRNISEQSDCHQPARHMRGTSDEQYHVTLRPDSPMVIAVPFNETRVKRLQVGEDYCIGVEEHPAFAIQWWRYGNVDEVLGDGADDVRSRAKSDGWPICFKDIAPVVFRILESGI